MLCCIFSRTGLWMKMKFESSWCVSKQDETDKPVCQNCSIRMLMIRYIGKSPLKQQHRKRSLAFLLCLYLCLYLPTLFSTHFHILWENLDRTVDQNLSERTYFKLKSICNTLDSNTIWDGFCQKYFVPKIKFRVWLFSHRGVLDISKVCILCRFDE